jgi:hypothetical protein
MQERLEFIYVLRSARVEMLTDGPTVNEAAAIGEHFAYLQDLTAKGVVVLAGRPRTMPARLAWSSSEPAPRPTHGASWTGTRLFGRAR